MKQTVYGNVIVDDNVIYSIKINADLAAVDLSRGKQRISDQGLFDAIKRVAIQDSRPFL